MSARAETSEQMFSLPPTSPLQGASTRRREAAGRGVRPASRGRAARSRVRGSIGVCVCVSCVFTA
eukprot:4194337-Prymnesium_polylepis.1